MAYTNQAQAAAILADAEDLKVVLTPEQSDILTIVASGNSNRVAQMVNGLGIEQLMNAMIPVFNKFGRQVVYDLLGGWDDTLTELFRRDSAEYGEYTGLLAVNIEEGVEQLELDDGLGNSPFDVKLADVEELVVKVVDRPQAMVTVSDIRLKQAFISEYGFADITDLIIDTARKRVKLHNYKTTKAQLFRNETKFKSYVVAPVSLDTPEASKEVYAEITNLLKTMSEPSRLYNKMGFLANTNKGRAIGIFNGKTSTIFDFNIIASLFNSDKVNNDSYFADIHEVMTDIPESVVALIGDPDMYRVEVQHDSLEAIRNPKNRTINYFMNMFVKRREVDFLDAVLIKTEIDDPWIDTRVTKDSKGNLHKWFKINGTINADTFYTTDGTEPQYNDQGVPTGTTQKYDGTSWIEYNKSTQVKMVSTNKKLNKTSAVITTQVNF